MRVKHSSPETSHISQKSVWLTSVGSQTQEIAVESLMWTSLTVAVFPTMHLESDLA